MPEGGSLRSVAVLTEVAALDKALDYLVPENFVGPLEPGSRVRVELNGRSVRGWILGPGLEKPGERQLKPLKASLGFGPPADVVELASWASWRWYGTRAKLLNSASPERIVRHLPRRPGMRTFSAPESPLGALGALRSSVLAPGLLEVGPSTDPFDLLLGFLAGLTESGRLDSGSALVLVPGVGYASRLVGRLSRRGIPALDASQSWEGARVGWPVVVGTRSAALSPIPELGGVLALDIEDERYRSEAAPTWSAIEALRERARRASAPCLFVAACPPAEAFETCDRLEVGSRASRPGWPRLQVVNRLEEDPRSGVLSSHLVAEARAALAETRDGVAVACIVNRTGRAKLLACSRCRSIASCETCDAAMVLEEELRCPRCGATRPIICQACGATKLKLLRLGTAQLAPELSLLLGVEVVEVTGSSGPDVLRNARAVVGTEAVLHRLRRARLVAFLDFDHHLLAPRVGAETRALEMIARAGRLVGGRSSDGSGTVLVQTRLVTHPVILAAQSGDPTDVLRADRELRAQLGLPPYRGFARVRGEGAASFVASLATRHVEIMDLGEGDFAVAAPSPEQLADALAATERPKERLIVSVDPESI